MTEYHFNGELAKKYGVNEAVFLHALAFWVAKNQANGKHLHDGRTWTYNTRAAWVKLFPFWTAKQIRRITDHLVEEKAVLTGNFSEDKADRTLWYALADPILEVYGLLAPTICPNGQMHLPERAQPIAQTGKCNKETVTNQLYTPPTPQGEGRKKQEISPEIKAILSEYAGADDVLAQALDGLMEIRMAKKAVNSETAVRQLLKRLDKFSGGDRMHKLALLEEATTNSWKTVYLPRGETPPQRKEVRHVE